MGDNNDGWIWLNIAGMGVSSMRGQSAMPSWNIIKQMTNMVGYFKGIIMRNLYQLHNGPYMKFFFLKTKKNIYILPIQKGTNRGEQKSCANAADYWPVSCRPLLAFRISSVSGHFLRKHYMNLFYYYWNFKCLVNLSITNWWQYKKRSVQLEESLSE